MIRRIPCEPCEPAIPAAHDADSDHLIFEASEIMASIAGSPGPPSRGRLSLQPKVSRPTNQKHLPNCGLLRHVVSHSLAGWGHPALRGVRPLAGPPLLARTTRRPHAHLPLRPGTSQAEKPSAPFRLDIRADIFAISRRLPRSAVRLSNLPDDRAPSTRGHFLPRARRRIAGNFTAMRSHDYVRSTDRALIREVDPLARSVLVPFANSKVRGGKGTPENPHLRPLSASPITSEPDRTLSCLNGEPLWAAS